MIEVKCSPFRPKRLTAYSALADALIFSSWHQKHAEQEHYQYLPPKGLEDSFYFYFLDFFNQGRIDLMFWSHSSIVVISMAFYYLAHQLTEGLRDMTLRMFNNSKETNSDNTNENVYKNTVTKVMLQCINMISASY